MVMQHHSQGTTSFFLKNGIHGNVPSTIQELHQQLCDFPNSGLAEKLMHFGSSLRGTRAYWKKCHYELTHMITQLGFPTFLFILTTTDTKWIELHSVMPLNNHCWWKNEHTKKIANVIQYPHIVVNYMHQRFNIFRELVLHKYLGVRYFWYRFVLVPLCHVVQDFQ